MVYEMLQDPKGYLWLGTNNGVSRFDGKYFRNYTYKDGLPSNDVVAMRVDVYGMLWLNCFGHKPTYFENNAFHVLQDSTHKLQNANYVIGINLDKHVTFISELYNQILITQNKQIKFINLTRYNAKYTTKISDNLFIIKQNIQNKSYYTLQSNNAILDSVVINSIKATSFSDEGNMYINNDKEIIELELTTKRTFKQTHFYANSRIIKVCLSKNYIILVDDGSLIYIYTIGKQKN
jgi:ligand-binding sensor domain-containing protein